MRAGCRVSLVCARVEEVFGKSNLVNKFIFSDYVLDFSRLPAEFFFLASRSFEEEVDKRK